MADVVELPQIGGAVLRLKTLGAVQAWFGDLEDYWDWFLSRSYNDPGFVNLGRSGLSECLAEIRDVVLSKSENWARRVPEIVRSRFQYGSPLGPGNPIVDAIRTQFADEPEKAYQGVGAFLHLERMLAMNQLIERPYIQHPVWQQAISLAAAYRAPKANPSKLTSTELVTRAEETVTHLVDEAVGELDKQRKDTGDLQERLSESAKITSDELKKAASDAINEINQTRADYEEVMRLKTPVDYWATKSGEHRDNVRTYRFWLTGLTLVFVPIMALVYWLGWLALDSFTGRHPSQALAMTVYVAGFVGAVTAIALWFIRIVVRLYMSQHHLSADAEERASLLRTYLALTLSGQVTDAERALVLASVFRPVPDGIVKDDGAPSFSPANMLAAVLDKRG